MDSYISTTCSNPNSNAFNIKMDFTGLETDIGENKSDRKRSGDSVLDDLVELKLKYQEYFWSSYTNVSGKEKKKSCLGIQFKVQH